MYVKGNPPPQVAAKEKLELEKDEYVLKRDTKWNYQNLSLMRILRNLNCDQVIYTHKGILIVHVKFDSDFWNECSRSIETFSLKTYSKTSYNITY